MMSIAENVPPPQLQRTSKGRRNARWAGFLHVLDVRMKELRREPEVIFWIFMFPILLALGLGIAFRNKPPDASRVVIAQQFGSERIAELLAKDVHSLKVDVQPSAQAALNFRLGKFDVELIPHGD